MGAQRIMADIIPRDFIALVLAKIDLVDLINLQVPLRKKSGSNYFARCPFHNEKSASFSVSHPKQFYYCFGCGAHGNAIDFLMNHDRLSFPEAIESLAKQVGMEVPKTAAHNKRHDSLPALFDLMSAVAKLFYDQMRKSPRAIQYLKQRNISGAIAQQFQLGFAPMGWHHLLDSIGKTETDKKMLLDTGLIIQKPEGGYYDRFRDRIMFPILDVRGRVIGFGGRIIDAGEPKYLNSPETTLFQKGHELYGLFQAIKANRKLQRVLIVEGYMDVIALFQHGITYAVATLGTATSQHHIERLLRYTNEIIFCFDGDQAGRMAALRALDVIFPIMQDNLQIRFLFLPENEDPDSLIRKEALSAFEKRIKQAPSLSAFFFHIMSKENDLTTLEGRARVAAAALPYIRQLTAPIFQDMLLQELSKRTRLDVSKLKEQITHQAEISYTAFTPVTTKTKLAPSLRLALRLLIQYPQLVAHVSKYNAEYNLPGHAFFLQLAAYIQQFPDLTTGALLEAWRNEKEQSFIAKLAVWEHMVPENRIEAAFLEALRQVDLLAVDKEIDKLLSKAASDGLSDQEKVELTQRISKKKQQSQKN